MMAPLHLGRRRFTLWAAGAVASPLDAVGQVVSNPVLADMHSHYGMFDKRAGPSDLRQEQESTGTTLVALSIVDDSPWIRTSPKGVKQVRTPNAGELWASFQKQVARYDAQLRMWRLPKVLRPTDVDAALKGQAHVVMASESANFLEGTPERVALAHAMGLRHLQLVHYIQSPLGDLQTEPPRHHGMPLVARKVLAECRRVGILVDLAHSTPAFVDEALAQSPVAVVWSHSWISRHGGTWQDWPNIARSLPLAQARKIAAHGGVMGLWTVRVRSDHTYKVRDAASYADEIIRMVDLVGPGAVAFGTDIDGAGQDPAFSDYSGLRDVANHLIRRGVSGTVLSDICFGNYARVLKQAMRG